MPHQTKRLVCLKLIKMENFNISEKDRRYLQIAENILKEINEAFKRKEYQWCLKNANEGYCKLHYKDAASYMEKNGFVFKVK